MKLSEFPSVLNAFEIILNDQPYPPHYGVHVDGAVSVPKKHLANFKVAEGVLAELSGLTLKQVGITAKTLKGECLSGDVELSESALEHFILPINDMCVRIMEKLSGGNIHKYTAAGKTANLLNEFFDGALREVFQKGNAAYNRYVRKCVRNVRYQQELKLRDERNAKARSAKS